MARKSKKFCIFIVGNDEKQPENDDYSAAIAMHSKPIYILSLYEHQEFF